MNGPLTLVTGASSGIGAEISRRLARSRPVLLHGRNLGRLLAVRDSCPHADRHRIWTCDLRYVESIEACLRECLDEHRVEAFVHCAGCLEIGAFRTMSDASALALFDVNFFSAVEIVRLLSDRTFNAGTLRSVVLISSGASLVGEKGNAMYAASKGALDSFMRSAAVELARTTRVNSVLPGIVRTAMSEPVFVGETAQGRLRANYPLGVADAADVASVVEFLVSDDARRITGQQICVDGGYTAHANHVR